MDQHMRRPSVPRLVPSTYLGWWALGLVLVGAVAFALQGSLVSSGVTDHDTFAANLFNGVTGIGGSAAVLTGGVVAGWTIAARRERSPAVAGVASIGTVMALLLVVDLLRP